MSNCNIPNKSVQLVWVIFFLSCVFINANAQEDFRAYELKSMQLSNSDKETYLNQVPTDSLLQWKEKTKKLQFKIDIYNGLGFTYRIKDTDLAIQYLDKALIINTQQQYSFGAFRSLKLKAVCYLVRGEYPKTRKWAIEAKNISQKMAYLKGVADAYKLVADAYDYEGNRLKALEFYLLAVKICEENGIEDVLSLIYYSIATFYNNQENYQKAEDYYTKAYQLALKIQDDISIQYLNSLALNLSKQGKPIKAVEYLQKNLARIEQTDYPRKDIDVSITHHTLGIVFNMMFANNPTDTTLLKQALHYLDKTRTSQLARNKFVIPETLTETAKSYELAKNYAQAEIYYQQALENALIRKNQNTTAMVLNSFARFHLAQYAYNAALLKAKQALEIAEKIGAAREKQTAAQTLATAYAQENQFEKAYQYQVRFKEISDSLYNAQINNSLLQAEFEYNFESQQKALRFEMQKKDLANQTEVTYQKRLRNLFILAFLLLLGLCYWVFRLYKKNRANYLIVNQQNTQLEFFNHRNESQKQILEKAYLKMKTNHTLLQKLNLALKEKNEEIQAQAEELTETNQTLERVNLKLKEKNEEVETQTEELREANEEISTINANLEKVVEERTARLVKAYADLAQTNKELDTFLYRSSHDLRRPLTTLMGLHTLAQITLREESAQQLFEKVNITAVNMDKMLNKLLMIYDINHYVKESQKVDFEVSVNKVKEKLTPLLQQYSLTWKQQIEPTLYLPSGSNLIQFILLNLVENAILYSRAPDAYVHIHIYTQNNKLHLVVSDNGQGIDANYHKQIFEMFFRANEKSQGNGLGLYIVKRAVARLKGELEFESVLGKGSTFKIILPMPSHS